MQITSGSLLVADPVRCHPFDENAVVLVTESSREKLAGIRLNLPDDRPFEQIVRPEFIDMFPERNIFLGGPVNPGALVMFHSNEWFSQNTMPLDEKWSISSDEFMLEKISIGNTPSFFRLCLGFTVLSYQQVQKNILSNRPAWLVLNNPSESVFVSDHNKMYDLAIKEISEQAVSQFF